MLDDQKARQVRESINDMIDYSKWMLECLKEIQKKDIKAQAKRWQKYIMDLNRGKPKND